MKELTEKQLIKMLRDDLKLPKRKEKETVNENYTVQTQTYRLPTELLSEKTKSSHQKIMEDHAASLNWIASNLAAVNRDEVENSNNSKFRGLKIDEVYNLNASFLHSMFFENISDVNSKVTVDSLAYMKLSRDFGDFDSWQKDFIACSLSARSGWAVTVYNTFLGKYMNVVCDLHGSNIPFSSIPVVVLDCWEHSYYKDYLNDSKRYTYAMMKELDWNVIEKRFEKTEKIAKVMK
jgi:Fe-Mn family superoxide dismutase